MTGNKSKDPDNNVIPPNFEDKYKKEDVPTLRSRRDREVWAPN